MSMSNYPNGFRYGLTVRNQPILSTHSGNIVWVGETPEGMAGSNGYDGTYNWPLATIDFAIGKCAANHGDIIIVKAGHTETVIAAGGITADVAGISIVGLGNGADRPSITFGTAAGASLLVSADSVTIENIVGISGVDLLTNPFHVTGDNCYLDIEWQDSLVTVEARTAVLASTVSNLNCIIKYKGFIAGDACYSAVQLDAVTGARVDVDAYGEFSVAIVDMLTVLSTDVLVTGYFYNDNVALTKNVMDTIGSSIWYCHGYDGKGGYEFSGSDTLALAADDFATIAAAIAVVDGLFDAPTADAATDTTIRDAIGRKTDTNAGTTMMAKQLVPTADWATNINMRDVVGNKADAASPVAANKSLMAYAKQNANQTLKIDGVTLAAVPTAASLASFIASSGVALGSQLPTSTSLVDLFGAYTGPVGGALADDNIKAHLDIVKLETASIQADSTAILADSITISGGALPADPTGSSLATFIATGGTALGTPLPATCSLYDVLAGTNGIPVFPAAAIPANAVSMAEVLREIYDQQEKAINTTAAVMSDNLTIFTVAGGPILLLNLLSICITDDNATASLLSYDSDPTDGAATALTIASGSLANKTAGYMCSMDGTVGSATVETAVGATAVTQALALVIPMGIIALTVAGGSTTGTWTHYLRYKPLGRSVVVTAAF